MKRPAKIVAVIAVVLFGLYYSVMTPSVSLRYRLTVNVDVNGVTHTGSGVIEITYQSLREWVIKSLPLDWASQFHGTMRGYAITVDLGDRGMLFVVNDRTLLTRSGKYLYLDGESLDLLPFFAYRSIFARDAQSDPISGPPSEVMGRARMIQDAKWKPVAISAEYLPMIVRFTDINDRHTIEEVDPQDLAAACGAGVRLESVTFELTDDPVTPMPRIWPTWLKLDKNGPIVLRQPQYFVGSFGLGTTSFKGD